MTVTTGPFARARAASQYFTTEALLALAREGKLRLPPFQRPFVWGVTDVHQLFDSLDRGFPIGSLLFWERPVPAEDVRFGLYTRSAPAADNGFLVVDGQQRLTTLVASLEPEAEGLDERFEVYYDLAKHRFVGPRRGQAPARSIPVRKLLSTAEWRAWERAHGESLDDEDLAAADRIGSALREYQIPAYVVKSDDENVLRQVFDRMNSAGKPISRAQVFHALFARGTDSRSFRGISAELEHLGFGEIPENRLVQSLLAIRGGDNQRDVHEEFEEDEDVDDWYEQTARALVLAIRFLRAQGVAHYALMPTSFPIPVLAAFFALHPEPDPWVRTLLARWLWRGWAHGFGREAGQTPMLRRAVHAVNPAKGEPDKAPDEYEAVEKLLGPISDKQVEAIHLEAFRTDNAQSRLAMLALANLRPLGPEGAPIDIAALMRDSGSAGVGHILPGPRRDVGVRGFWPPEARPVNLHTPTEVLRSQAFNDAAVALLRQGSTAAAGAARAEHIHSLTLDLVNNRTSPGIRTRPSIPSLFVPDPE